MQLCEFGLRRLSISWRQSFTGTPVYSPQIQCVADTRAVRKKCVVTSVPFAGFLARCSSAVAVKENGESGNEFAPAVIRIGLPDVAAQIKSPEQKPPSDTSPNAEPSQDSPAVEPDAKHSPGNVSNPVTKGSRAHSRLRVSRFRAQRRRKEDRLLVNQQLKDKGQLSYDWRIPLRMLESVTYAAPLKVEAHHDHHSADTHTNESADVPCEEQAELNTRRVLSNHPSSCVMRVLSRDRSDIDLAQNVPRPSVWTVSSLSNYIEDVANTQYANDRMPQVPSGTKERSSNRAEIVRIFDRIFCSHYFKRYISVKAYNTALTFYFNQGLVSKGRSLFGQMEESEVFIPRETFNLLLRGAASSKDLHNYTFILSKSLQRGFRPDAETWNLLLMAITSDEVRAVVTQRMWERGRVGVWSKERGMMRLIVQNELGSHVERRGDRGAFLDHLDERYGPEWLTNSTGNKLLHEFSKCYGVLEALALLPGMKQRGFAADHVSLDTLVQHCLQLKQHRNAVGVLARFDHLFGVKPGRKTHEALFVMAWRGRLLNFARIVWRYACIHGYVTFKMRNLVFQSLLGTDPPQTSSSRSLRFRELVGRFVTNSVKPHNFKDSSLFLDQSSKSRHSDRFRVRLAKARLCSDLRLAQTMITAGSSERRSRRLLYALKLDERWAAEKIPQSTSLQQLYQDGIRMDVVKAATIQRRRKLMRTGSLPNMRLKRRIDIRQKGPRMRRAQAPVIPGTYPVLRLRKHIASDAQTPLASSSPESETSASLGKRTSPYGPAIRKLSVRETSAYRLVTAPAGPSPVEKAPPTAAKGSSEDPVARQNSSDKIDQCSSSNSATMDRVRIRRYQIPPLPSPEVLPPPPPPVSPSTRKISPRIRRYLIPHSELSRPSDRAARRREPSPTQDSQERPVRPEKAEEPVLRREIRMHRLPVRQIRQSSESDETAQLLASLDDLLGVSETARAETEERPA